MGNRIHIPVSKILFRTSLIMSVLGIVLISVYYFFERDIINQSQMEEAEVISDLIMHSIEINDEAMENKEVLINLLLHNISKSISDSLSGKKIDDITYEELNELKRKWNLHDISLFVKEEDGIVIRKSTDQNEEGLNAKGWNYWYDALVKLYNREAVDINKGYYKPNYWVGPISKSEIYNIYFKYAYYYDGSTDFIINPYISSDEFANLISKGDTSSLINKIVNHNHQGIEEVAVINIDSFLSPKKNIVEPQLDLPIVNGTNKIGTKNDFEIIRSFKDKKETGIKLINIMYQNKPYKKAYVPINKKQILLVTLDQSYQKKIEHKLIVLLISLFVITILLIVLSFRVANKKAQSALESDYRKFQVAEDFKRTIEILPDLIFKLEKNHFGIVTISYLEGNKLKQMCVSPDGFIGKRMEEILPNEVVNNFQIYIEEGFEGKDCEFDIVFEEKMYHIVMKPTIGGEMIDELAGYAVDVTERFEFEKKIENLAFFDNLTGLPNRNHFSRHCERLIQNKMNKFALFFIDLDNFKMINDTLGHLAGDQVLESFSKRIVKATKDKQAFLARMGGDEFTLIIESYTEMEELVIIAKKVLDILKDPFFVENKKHFLTASIGISLFPENGENINELLKNADIAMYHSKSKNKNCYSIYSSEMGADTERNSILLNDLGNSIKNRELFLVYQPQYKIMDSKIYGVEALVRWNHPKFGVISPLEFITLAENNYMIDQIGDWVISEACLQFKNWQKEGLELERIAINLSKIQLLDSKLPTRINEILQSIGFDASQLTLEVTESATVDNVNEITSVLNEIKDLGVTIAIDDFGIEHSSLNYLKILPIDYLKIDRSFIKEMDKSIKSKEIIKLIIDLANRLDLEVVAEGVESVNQLVILEEMGCHSIQGYFISKPLDSNQIQIFLEKFNLTNVLQ
ncbi:putative bifunctional diguanylate cyclase/phosphodiesterase [Bacillus sp. CGMCC 1.16607]|uniref:putative bifunctional diguanylate cyclase/phosphodiesterase n=1 Tax=Bacillus sp. CGMCC 1.16607 TaxID=3351842 RepID=UPI00363E0F9B